MGVQIVFGETIENKQNQTLGITTGNALVNPTMVFVVPVIPATLSFAAVVLTENLDFGKAHLLKFTVVNKESSDKVNEIAVNFPVQDVTPSKTFNFNLDFRNVLFSNEGEYELLFKIDDDEKGRQSFKIIQVEQEI